jgi:hypothetical protein
VELTVPQGKDSSSKMIDLNWDKYLLIDKVEPMEQIAKEILLSLTVDQAHIQEGDKERKLVATSDFRSKIHS